MASTNQTIRNFFQVAAQREFSRDFLFRVLSINFAGGATFNESELVYVRTATLPGRSINDVDAKYMGVSFHIPGGVTYPNSGSYSLEFYCDSQSAIREKFIAESRRTFDDATSTGAYNIPTASSVIRLMQLDKNLDPVTIYRLVGCSIRDVSEMSYSIAEGTGNYQTFTVTTAYHFFEEQLAS